MKVYLQNHKNQEVCFMHAVQRALKGEYISIKDFDDSDCGQSGWWIGGCVDCNKELEEDNG